MKKILLATAAVLALTACGGGSSGEGASDASSSTTSSASSLKTPLDKPFSLKNAEPLDVDALLAAFPEPLRPTYESVAFDEKLGATVLTNVVMPSTDESAATTIERVELFGVDRDALGRIDDEVEDGAERPLDEVFRKIRFFGLRGGDEGDGASTIEAGEIDRLRIRQGTGAREFESAAEAIDAFSLDGLYLRAVAFGAPDTDGDGPTNASIGAVALTGLAGGAFDAFTASNLVFETAPPAESSTSANIAELFLGGEGGLDGLFGGGGAQKTVIGSIDWRGFDYSGLVSRAVEKKDVKAGDKNLALLGVLKMTDADYYIDGELAAKTPLTTVTGTESQWVLPSKVRMETEGAEYRPTVYAGDNEQLLSFLSEEKLEKVSAKSEAAWDWDARRGEASFSSVLSADRLFDFNSDLQFDGLKEKDLQKLLDDVENETPYLDLARLKSLSVVLDEERLLDAAFAFAAAQQGSSAEELRQSLPSIIRLVGAQAAIMMPRAGGYVNAVADFLSEGGRLEVAAKPKKPTPLADIAAAGEAGPQELPELLNLTVKHTSKK